jgi:hypothetical protein
MSDGKYIEVASQMWWAVETTGNMKMVNGKITFIK